MKANHIILAVLSTLLVRCVLFLVEDMHLMTTRRDPTIDAAIVDDALASLPIAYTTNSTPLTTEWSHSRSMVGIALWILYRQALIQMTGIVFVGVSVAWCDQRQLHIIQNCRTKL